MKKILIKHLIYTNGAGEVTIGATEYNADLTDENILGAIHEVGKTQWIGRSLWLMKQGVPAYKITVETFTQYEKNWFDLIIDAVRRI